MWPEMGNARDQRSNRPHRAELRPEKKRTGRKRGNTLSWHNLDLIPKNDKDNKVMENIFPKRWQSFSLKSIGRDHRPWKCDEVRLVRRRAAVPAFVPRFGTRSYTRSRPGGGFYILVHKPLRVSEIGMLLQQTFDVRGGEGGRGGS